MKNPIKDENYLFLTKESILNYVSSLYRLILHREPDNYGLQHKVEQLLSGKSTLEKIVNQFLNSPEGKARAFTKVWSKRTSNYYLDLIEDLDVINQLFAKTAHYWQRVGFNEKMVYFSVLSSEKHKGKLTQEQILNFYKSGDKFIDFCASRLSDLGLNNCQELTCLDFGCGVGRLSFPASRQFRNDISVDVILSYIALQHNTPSVIAHIVRKLLNMLRIGGLALLHIPIHHPFYNFSETKYLSSKSSGTKMEMMDLRILVPLQVLTFLQLT